MAGPSADGAVPAEGVTARVITVSDRCARGEREDLSGPLAARLLAEAGIEAGPVVVVPDGLEPVRTAIGTALGDGCRFVLTTGGTGIGPRDLTPEATGPLLAARLDGLA
ncbi:molybdopterin-binding protein, partial [uncultured Propionibacterium sp.]|uniref:MogA/MoaB family molybdenum cofactor biosynthesis protein n=1 Tax=uncultured Propionibacterium sp. TaxID=218066 RepID=UPI00292F005F